MIFLNKADIIESITYAELMESIEESYRAYAENKYTMPLRLAEHMDNNSMFLMPCINEKGFGTKVLTLFPDNVKMNIPSIDGIMVLNDINTGVPTALMDAKALTALRTGAVGGVAIKYLTPENVESVGIVGAGMQGFHQAIFAANVRKLKILRIYDQRKDSLENFISKLSEEIPYPVDIKAAANVEELMGEVEMVITATTAAEPVIPNNIDLIKNKFFIGIGAAKPHTREYPESFFKVCDRIFIDTEHAFEEAGDLIIPLQNGWIHKDKISFFSDVINSEDKKHFKTVMFKSVGMALFDLFAAQKIFEAANKKGIGQKVDF